MTEINEQTAANEDDGDELISTGAIRYAYYYVRTGLNYDSFFRWEAAIPQGATINTCYVEFYVYTSSYDDMYVDIHFEKAASPAALTGTASEISDKNKTTASVAWSESNLATGQFHQSASLVTPLQEVVDNYTTTHIGVILIDQGTNDCRVYGYDHDDHSYGAKLYVDYTAAGGQAYPQSSSVAMGLDSAASRAGVLSRTSLPILGLDLSVSRPISINRSSSNTLGFVASVIKGFPRSASTALGMAASVSRSLVGSVTSQATLGTAISILKDLTKESLNTLGLSTTASRLLATARSASVTIGTSVVKGFLISSVATLGLKVYSVFRERIKRKVLHWRSEGFPYDFPFQFLQVRKNKQVGDNREISSVGTDRIVRSK